MNRSERRWTAAAVVLSVLLHAAVAWPLWNLSLGSGGGINLFASTSRADDQPAKVERSTRDQIVGDAGPDELAIEQHSSRTKVDVKRMVTAESPAHSPLNSGEIMPALRNMTAANLNLGLGNVELAVTDLSRVDAQVAMPRYVGPSDGVKVAAPSDEPIRPAQRVHVGTVTSQGKGPGRGTGSATDMIAGNGSSTSGGGGGGGTVLPEPLPIPEPVPPTTKQLPVSKVDEHLDEDFEYVLTRYDGPARVEQRWLFGGGSVPNFRGFALEIRPRPSLKRLAAMGKDVVYVIDTSGSIGGKWLDSVKAGAAAAMDALNQGDHFNVVLFAEKVHILDADGMEDANDANIAKARQFISAGSSAGYTDVNQALAKLVRRSMPNDRVYQIIFISDGQPTKGDINPRQIIDAFTRENNLTAAIYAVAVGDGVNQPLLGALAYRNKGYVISGQSPAKCADVIRDLAGRLRYPILKDATFSEAGVDANEIYPQQPRDVYQNDPVLLLGRYDRLDQKLSMRMVGVNGAKRMDFSTTKNISDAQVGDVAIARAWAERKMHHLTAALLRQAAGDQTATQKLIDALKKDYGLE